MEFNADMWCSKCQRVTEHHIITAGTLMVGDALLAGLGNLEGVEWTKTGNVRVVIFSRICLRPLYPIEDFCIHRPTPEFLSLKNWNALVKLGKEDYPEYFDTRRGK